MGLFKDFKEDFSAAVNELMPGDEEEIVEEKVKKETTKKRKKAAPAPEPKKEFDDDFLLEPELGSLDDDFSFDLDISEASSEELSKLDGLLRDVEVKANGISDSKNYTESNPEDYLFAMAGKEAAMDEEKPLDELDADEALINLLEAANDKNEPQVDENEKLSDFFGVAKEEFISEPEALEDKIEETVEAENINDTELAQNVYEIMEEEKKMEPEVNVRDAFFSEISDEISVITDGTTLKGNMESAGSIDLRGRIEGDVKCNGKLSVSGFITGKSQCNEFFADNANIEGDITAEGAVKIGLGSVIIGNVTATSAVVAGAVKGDIDVHGPVIVDTSAVIMGNIKSRSVQINNGAVIEGFCSQCYSDIDVEKLFGSHLK